MDNDYPHKDDPLTPHVIRDLLTNYLPKDWEWSAVREYVDWGNEYHLSHGGYMPKGNVYGTFYRALEKFCNEGTFEKYKEYRKSYYRPIELDVTQVLLNAICDVHDALFTPIDLLQNLISGFEGLVAMKSELESNKAELERLKGILQTNFDKYSE